MVEADLMRAGVVDEVITSPTWNFYSSRDIETAGKGWSQFV